MIRRLIVSNGNRERELALVGTIVVGRDPECDVSEDADSLLSRRHTEFTVGPTGVTVRDLNSRNGTFVNGVKTVETLVQAGDVVQIGHIMVRYVEGDAPIAPRPAASAAPDPDDDVTRVVRMPPPPPPAQPSKSPAVVPATPADDRTLVGPRPGLAAPSVAPAPSPADDGDRTMIVRPPAPPVAAPAAAPPVIRPSAPAPAPAPAAAVPVAPVAGPAAKPSVLGPVSILGIVAFLSVAVPEWLQGNGAPWRFAPGLVITLVAIYVTSASISRYVTRLVDEAREARR